MNQPASNSGATGPVLTPVGKWVAGARPKTLGAAISPVLVGTAAATADGPLRWWRALAALVVSLALQVGVNYANDYSDGVRGTDKNRRGPVRLVASGLASPGRGAQRRVDLLRCRRRRRRGALAGREPVAAARRAARDRRGRDVHRWAQAVRLHRPRRSHGARVLRLRRDGRQRVRAARVDSRRRPGSVRSRSASRRARSCSRTTSATSTPTASRASRRSPCAWARHARGSMYVVCIVGALSPSSRARCSRRPRCSRCLPRRSRSARSSSCGTITTRRRSSPR